MKSRHFLTISVICAFIMVLTSGLVLAQAPAATPLDTSFTYQGLLKGSSSTPITNTCDFRFSLWDSLESGLQIGENDELTGISVSAGYFTATVNAGNKFGSNAFNGEARWLNVEVKCGSEGDYTPLSPRQLFSATPYAYFANTIYKRTILVHPIGTATENGTALLAALANISEASASNPYLIKLEPGAYDLDLNSLQMKAYVDIEGSGEAVTLVTSNASGDKCQAPTIFGEDNTELRFLTVKNTAIDGWAIAICNNAASPKLTHLTAVVDSGGDANTCAVLNQGGASPSMVNVIARATGGATNTGVSNETNSSTLMRNMIAFALGGDLSANTGMYNQTNSPTLEDVAVSASGGITSTNIGVYNNSHASPLMHDMAITVSGGDGSNNRGVLNTSYSSPTMIDMTILASAIVNHSTNYGVRNEYYSSPVMETMIITASGGVIGSNIGVTNYSLSSPTMRNMTASATGGRYATGVDNDNSFPTMMNFSAFASGASDFNHGVANRSAPSKMINVTAYASGGSGTNYGVFNFGMNSFVSPTMMDMTISASGGSHAYGIYNQSCKPIMTNVSASALDGTNNNYGVYNIVASATIQNSTISASGTSAVGIYNSASSGTYTITVSNSQIVGVDHTISNNSFFTTRIGASQLSGGDIQNPGTITCIGVYDENYTSPGYTTCP